MEHIKPSKNEIIITSVISIIIFSLIFLAYNHAGKGTPSVELKTAYANPDSTVILAKADYEKSNIHKGKPYELNGMIFLKFDSGSEAKDAVETLQKKNIAADVCSSASFAMQETKSNDEKSSDEKTDGADIKYEQLQKPTVEVMSDEEIDESLESLDMSKFSKSQQVNVDPRNDYIYDENDDAYDGKKSKEATETFFNEKKATVAVIDSGCNTKDDRILEGFSFVADDDSIKDHTRHGTDMTKIILKNTYDNVSVIPIKVTNENETTLGALCLGVQKAIDLKVDVINISMAGVGKSAVLENLINKATNQGITVVVSAGNDGKDAKNYMPANIEASLTVGSLNNNGERASFSNYGDCVDVWVKSKLYGKSDGTSAAAAITSARVASLYQFVDDMNRDKAEKLLANNDFSETDIGKWNLSVSEDIVKHYDENGLTIKDLSKNEANQQLKACSCIITGMYVQVYRWSTVSKFQHILNTFGNICNHTTMYLLQDSTGGVVGCASGINTVNNGILSISNVGLADGCYYICGNATRYTTYLGFSNEDSINGFKIIKNSVTSDGSGIDSYPQPVSNSSTFIEVSANAWTNGRRQFWVSYRPLQVTVKYKDRDTVLGTRDYYYWDGDWTTYNGTSSKTGYHYDNDNYWIFNNNENQIFGRHKRYSNQKLVDITGGDILHKDVTKIAKIKWIANPYKVAYNPGRATEVHYNGNYTVNNRNEFVRNYVYDKTYKFPNPSSIFFRRYTISYDLNDRALNPENELSPASIAAPSDIFSWSFAGWHGNNQDDSKTSYLNSGYQADTKFKNLTATNNGLVTLYARYACSSKELREPGRVGYTFRGWYYNSNPGNLFRSVNNVDSNRTVYASWTPNQYKVMFDKQGGYGGSDSTIVTYDAYPGQITTPKREYTMTFDINDYKGSTDAAYKYETYENDDVPVVYINGDKFINGDQVDYNKYAGKWQSVSEFENTRDGALVKITIPCTFKGYFMQPNGAGKQYYAGNDKPDVYEIKEKGIHCWREPRNTTLYANWKNNPIKLPTVERLGYKFLGWYTDPINGKRIGGCGDVVILNSNDKVYAHWKPIEYKAALLPSNDLWRTHNTDNDYAENPVFSDQPMDNITLTFDTPKPLPTNAYASPGYNFVNWWFPGSMYCEHPTNKSLQKRAKPQYFEDMAEVANLSATEGDVVCLYAQWSPVETYINYNFNLLDITQNYTSNITNSLVPSQAHGENHGYPSKYVNGEIPITNADPKKTTNGFNTQEEYDAEVAKGEAKGSEFLMYKYPDHPGASNGSNVDIDTSLNKNIWCNPASYNAFDDSLTFDDDNTDNGAAYVKDDTGTLQYVSKDTYYFKDGKRVYSFQGWSVDKESFSNDPYAHKRSEEQTFMDLFYEHMMINTLLKAKEDSAPVTYSTRVDKLAEFEHVINGLKKNWNCWHVLSADDADRYGYTGKNANWTWQTNNEGDKSYRNYGSISFKDSTVTTYPDQKIEAVKDPYGNVISESVTTGSGVDEPIKVVDSSTARANYIQLFAVWDRFPTVNAYNRYVYASEIDTVTPEMLFNNVVVADKEDGNIGADENYVKESDYIRHYKVDNGTMTIKIIDYHPQDFVDIATSKEGTGTVTITYEVTDSAGNMVHKSINVVVLSDSTVKYTDDSYKHVRVIDRENYQKDSEAEGGLMENSIWKRDATYADLLTSVFNRVDLLGSAQSDEQTRLFPTYDTSNAKDCWNYNIKGIKEQVKYLYQFNLNDMKETKKYIDNNGSKQKKIGNYNGGHGENSDLQIYMHNILNGTKK